MQEPSSLLIRPGEAPDCSLLAEFINQSSQGAVDYLFKDLAGQRSPLDIMAELLSSEVHYSYANTFVVEANACVSAMVLSFPASGVVLQEQLQKQYSAQQLQYLKYFVENKLEDSWHLDAICVDAAHRNQGLGGQLLDKVKQHAQSYQFDLLEVFVFATNTGAVNFYQNHGFELQKEINTEGHEFLAEKGPLLLMSLAI